MSRPVLAQLDLQALKDNLQIVRRAAPASRVWTVVKANAYGHGLDRVWSALSATDGFALLNLEEAILLRERGWKGPILMLEGFFHSDELPLFDKYRLTTSVHSNWQVKALQNAKLHAPLDIYLKVNSGMNRLGFQPERVHSVWQQLRALKNVGEMTLMAHFADAEKPDGIADPMMRIEQAAEGLDCPRSLSNSAATLWHPEAHFDWVRPGIILYGASPSGQWQDIANSGLKPVMSLRSEIIGVQTLKAGIRWATAAAIAPGASSGSVLSPAVTPTAIRVLPLPARRCGWMAYAPARWVPCRWICWRLISPCPQAGIGTPVELWGNEVKVDDVAAAAGTVGYELLTALAPRVPVVTI